VVKPAKTVAIMTKQPLWQRWLWFIALWAAGVVTVTLVGLAIRTVLL
jgi:hypothetical protein